MNEQYTLYTYICISYVGNYIEIYIQITINSIKCYQLDLNHYHNQEHYKNTTTKKHNIE